MSLESFEHSIESPSLRSVVRHWAESRRGRRMPGWDDLKPSAIKDQLANIWSYRFDSATGDFVGRLAGERIEFVLGMSVRGRNMRDLFAQHDYQMAYERHLRVVTEPAFFRGHGLVYRHIDRFDLGERIIMPLAQDGQHPDGIFGVTEFESTYGAPPEEILRGAEIAEWFTLE
ncbi:MAG TPA: PAS domain-containing protein [Rhizomicrobium sp.]|nr:PAS domain-containing protein [Rhizomicrobium sp.]